MRWKPYLLPIGVLATELRFFEYSAYHIPLRRLLGSVSINAQGLNVNLASAGSYLAEGRLRGHIVFGLGEAHAGTQLVVFFKGPTKDRYVGYSNGVGEFSEKYFMRHEKLVHLIKIDEQASTCDLRRIVLVGLLRGLMGSVLSRADGIQIGEKGQDDVLLNGTYQD